ncbi:MAG: hypothetical protein H7257_07335 [Taibaiella sp.]|nr:hypothetical protein [Taibaiella sp.]
MAKKRIYKILRILLLVVLSVIIIAAAGIAWLSFNYRQIIASELPAIVARSSDSMYHITYTAIDIHFFKHEATVTGLKIWGDTGRVAALRQQKQRVPSTITTMNIAGIHISGIAWNEIVRSHTVHCTNVDVGEMKWLLACTPHPEDSAFTRRKSKKPFLNLVVADHITITDPQITYKFEGKKSSFSLKLNGGSARLDDWRYNFDEKKDTSIFLYARNGNLRFNDLLFLKPAGTYTAQKPTIDFSTTDTSVTLKEIVLKKMANHDPKTGATKEIYSLHFPSIELRGFNWNNLVKHNKLELKRIVATQPDIDIRSIQQYKTGGKNRMGAYPHQLLLKVGIKTNVNKLDISKGKFKYTEITDKGKEGIIAITNIQANFSNITNLDSVIALHKTCGIHLTGTYGGKSEIAADVALNLVDTTGRFSLDGYIKNLTGDDVVKQVQAFSIVQVTSFYLSKLDIHVEGDEHFGTGSFTPYYKDLKISLFKFKSEQRKEKDGLFSFLGSSLVLYPSNPMPGKEVRKTSSSLAREPEKGFIGMIWKHVFRGVKKAAVRENFIITATAGKEDKPGEKPHKKGFLTRLFGKKRK